MIRIPRRIIEDIVAQARAELPNEACGLLTGSVTEVGAEVATRHPMRNVDACPEHFSFDPREQFAVLKIARAGGQRIVANYHSHPSTPARPSEEDIRLAYDPSSICLILSLAGQEPVVRAFSVRDGQATEVVLEII